MKMIGWWQCYPAIKSTNIGFSLQMLMVWLKPFECIIYVCSTESDWIYYDYPKVCNIKHACGLWVKMRQNENYNVGENNIKRGEKENVRETNFSTNRKKLNSFAPISINLKLNSSRYENRKRYAILPSYTKRNKVNVRVYWFFTSGIEREKIYNGWATDWWNQYSIHLIYVQKYWITNLQHVCVCGNCLREYFFTVLQVTYLSKSSIEKRNGNNDDDDDVVDCGRPIPLNWFTYASCLSYIQAMDLLFKLKHTHARAMSARARTLFTKYNLCSFHHLPHDHSGHHIPRNSIWKIHSGKSVYVTNPYIARCYDEKCSQPAYGGIGSLSSTLFSAHQIIFENYVFVVE